MLIDLIHRWLAARGLRGPALALLADALGVLCPVAAMWLVNRVAKSIIGSVVRRIVPRSPYLEQKRGELAAERCEREDEAPAGCRPVSNIGCFRAHVTAYLKAHPMLRQDTHFFVRQREPTDKGLRSSSMCSVATRAGRRTRASSPTSHAAWHGS